MKVTNKFFNKIKSKHILWKIFNSIKQNNYIKLYSIIKDYKINWDYQLMILKDTHK